MPASKRRRTIGAKRIAAACGVEPALGGDLLAAFGHDAAGVRPGADGDGGHLLRCGHLKVERCFDLRHKPSDILVADVAAVLAQMRGNAVGAGLDGNLGGAYRIGTG